ncbi:MAG TPA: hypothetical protein P5572_20060 [Phycisphaerae bacterium]|nr:hypothetical protein [Phycisphaerae bacterium]
MPRNHTLTIQPSISVDRAALAGGVLAAASELGGEVCDLNARFLAARQPLVEYTVPYLTLAPNGAERFGVAVVHAGAVVAVLRRADGTCVLTASHDTCDTGAALDAARTVGDSLFRQLVLRRITRVFRLRGYAIVERCTPPSGAVVLRTRLPVASPMQPSARTAPPEFAVEVDAGGCVTVHLAGLHRHGRGLVQDTLVHALRETVPVGATAGHAA